MSDVYEVEKVTLDDLRVEDVVWAEYDFARVTDVTVMPDYIGFTALYSEPSRVSRLTGVATNPILRVVL